MPVENPNVWLIGMLLSEQNHLSVPQAGYHLRSDSVIVSVGLPFWYIRQAVYHLD